MDRYRVLVEQIPAVVFMALLDGGVSEAYVSPQVEQVLGFSRDEWLDDPIRWYRQIHRDDRNRWSTEAAEILLKGNPLKSVYRVIARDGRVVWFHCEARLVRRPDGQPWFIHGVAIDISDLKRAEQALQEESAERERLQRLELERQSAKAQQIESKLAAIVELSDDAIISKNLDSVITTWNNGAERLFGYSAEEAIGKHVNFIIPPDRRDEEVGILARVRSGERVNHFHTVRMRKDGTLLDISLTVSPLKDSTGRVIGTSKIARDITRQMRIELALRQSEEKFRELVETLDLQIQSRTSELEERNAEVLRQTEELQSLSFRLLKAQDDERRHLARELHDSAGQLLAALAMNLSQIVWQAKQHDPQLAKSAEQAEAIVQQLTKDIRTTSYLLHPPLLDENGLSSALGWYIEGVEKRSGLQIQLTISEGFGRLPSDMELVVFRLVQECLTNIHRHSGSKTAAIRIDRGAENISIHVEDQGHGIPPEKLTEIYSQGSGVGIRGMRERLRQFGGELIIHSDGSGTRISAAIPIPK
ncbi:MAG: PAS domain S-box protein [Terriglobia bacterium]